MLELFLLNFCLLEMEEAESPKLLPGVEEAESPKLLPGMEEAGRLDLLSGVIE